MRTLVTYWVDGINSLHQQISKNVLLFTNHLSINVCQFSSPKLVRLKESLIDALQTAQSNLNIQKMQCLYSITNTSL